jgi:hypothetical protein
MVEKGLSNRPEIKCHACSRKTSMGKYCRYHNEAFNDIKRHYQLWVSAYGLLSWNDFLNKLLTLNETGTWIKEVILIELN